MSQSCEFDLVPTQLMKTLPTQHNSKFQSQKIRRINARRFNTPTCLKLVLGLYNFNNVQQIQNPVSSKKDKQCCSQLDMTINRTS